jgi:hypothetical protein
MAPGSTPDDRQDHEGDRVPGLLLYLFGPGRDEEHADPHLVAG